MSEYLEYNKDKTEGFFKQIERHESPVSTKEQYIIVLFEKIIEEFVEPFYGYIRVNTVIKPFNVKGLQFDDKIEFYFWVNVAGVCSITQKGKISPIFEQYQYVSQPPKHINGFKLMNDEKEMMKLILPKLVNQGEAAYKADQEAAEKEQQKKAKDALKA